MRGSIDFFNLKCVVLFSFLMRKLNFNLKIKVYTQYYPLFPNRIIMPKKIFQTHFIFFQILFYLRSLLWLRYPKLFFSCLAFTEQTNKILQT